MEETRGPNGEGEEDTGAPGDRGLERGLYMSRLCHSAAWLESLGSKLRRGHSSLGSYFCRVLAYQ